MCTYRKTITKTIIYTIKKNMYIVHSLVDNAFKIYVNACKTMKMIIQEIHSHLILRY